MEFEILGNPRTKKNSQQFSRRGGKPCLRQSEVYQKYKKEFLFQMSELKKENPEVFDNLPIDRPVNISCTYYRGDNRRVDLVNLQNGTLDLLTEAGIIKDDNCDIVQSMDGSRVYKKKDGEVPRVVINISDFKL